MALSDSTQSPVTLVHLPATYQVTATDAAERDDWLATFLGAYENVNSTIEHTINTVAECFDPQTAEPNFLTWLGTWVGVDLGEVETATGGVSPEMKRRRLVKDAAVLWRHRGTVRGLKAALEAFYDAEVDIEEWAWPQSMSIELSSTIGIDTVLLPNPDPGRISRSFVAIWKMPEQFESLVRGGEWHLALRCQDGKLRRQLRAHIIAEQEVRVGLETLRSKAQKIRNAIDRERPAHTHCYLALGWEQVAAFATQPMQIEIQSTISAFFFN